MIALVWAWVIVVEEEVSFNGLNIVDKIGSYLTVYFYQVGKNPLVEKMTILTTGKVVRVTVLPDTVRTMTIHLT